MRIFGLALFGMLSCAALDQSIAQPTDFCEQPNTVLFLLGGLHKTAGMADAKLRAIPLGERSLNQLLVNSLGEAGPRTLSVPNTISRRSEPRASQRIAPGPASLGRRRLRQCPRPTAVAGQFDEAVVELAETLAVADRDDRRLRQPLAEQPVELRLGLLIER